MFAHAKPKPPSTEFKVVTLRDPPRYHERAHARHLQNENDAAAATKEHNDAWEGIKDVEAGEATYEQRKKIIDMESTADGSKKMVPEYFAHLADPANPQNRRGVYSENSVGGVGREPSPHKLRDFYTDVCNQRTDPKYIKEEKKFKADKQIEEFGHVLLRKEFINTDLTAPDNLFDEGMLAMSYKKQQTTDPFSLEKPQGQEVPLRRGKMLVKAKLDGIVMDESADRCAGLRSEKVGEMDERVMYETDGDLLKWEHMNVRPTLQRHKGYANATVQRSLALQEVGCEFPSSPTRHRCLEGPEEDHLQRPMFRGPSQTLEGFRRISQAKEMSEMEMKQQRSNFVIG